MSVNRMTQIFVFNLINFSVLISKKHKFYRKRPVAIETRSQTKVLQL